VYQPTIELVGEYEPLITLVGQTDQT
jgi:hypothetical protein